MNRLSLRLNLVRFTQLLLTVFTVLLLVFILLLGTRLVLGLLFPVELVKELPSVKAYEASKVYAADGSLIATFSLSPKSRYVRLKEMPPSLKNAVVAIEDERFYHHRGVDLRAAARALVANLRGQKIVEGGSTITQQYVKNHFLSPERTFSRKLREIILAYRLEQKYSKDQILEDYLNTIYFGGNYYGVEAAAQGYFGKPATRLDLTESALLAGIIRSPSNYYPYSHKVQAKKRRNTVLGKMAGAGYISKNEAETASREPLDLGKLQKQKVKYPYFVDYVHRELLKNFGPDQVYKGGLKVYTTLDISAQQVADEAVRKIFDQPGDPASVLVAIDPRRGEVKAIACNTDFEKLQFNLATQGKRQPGSAFKTFVLTTALEQGIQSDQLFESSPIDIQLPRGEVWKVQNYIEGSGGPPMTLRDATIYSVNAVFARLMMMVKPENVVAVARRMGITTPLNTDPAIALGGLSIGVSPLEMASAYGTLANLGVHNEPTPFRKVVNGKGRIIWKNRFEGQEAIDPATAVAVTQILEGVIKQGTGTSARINRPAAGKTGTSQEYRDAWFIGYTPELVASVWVGYPEGQIAMTNVHGVKVTGGTFPAQIWSHFMNRALEKKKPSSFTSKDYLIVRICPVSMLLATPYCPSPLTLSLRKEFVPEEYCDIHVALPTSTLPNQLPR